MTAMGKYNSKSDEIGAREWPWTSFLGAHGGSGCLFGPFCSDVALQCARGRFLRMPGFIFGVIWSPKSMKVGVDFRCFYLNVFWEGFGVVLGLFGVFLLVP